MGCSLPALTVEHAELPDGSDGRLVPAEHVEKGPVVDAPDADGVVFAARQKVGRLVKLQTRHGSCRSGGRSISSMAGQRKLTSCSCDFQVRISRARAAPEGRRRRVRFETQ